MFKLKSIKKYIRQILALVEKEIFLELRYKSQVISRFLNPLIRLLILFFIFGLLFNIKAGLKIGYWDASNYMLFLLIAFCLQFSNSIIYKYHIMFMREKYWKTLSTLMIAPINRFTLLIGGLFSELLIISIPVAILLIIAYILYPISICFLLLVFLVFVSIYLTLASIGLIIGVYAISNEEYVPYFRIFMTIVMTLSCRNYPKEIFPEVIQYLILLNPFYYLFDLLRLVWYLGINYEIAINHITLIHITTIILFTLISPLVAIILFNRVYKKHGITGY